MERLTYYTTGMYFLNCNVCGRKVSKNCHDNCNTASVLRLGTIEDILGPTYDLSRLKELVEADREGRCVVLPCKIGEKLYHVHGKNVLPVSALWFETNAKGWCVCGSYPPMATLCFAFDDFGKTVFLTREEAEKALEVQGEKAFD